MYVDEALLFARRSIERREAAPRAWRYLRSYLNLATRRNAATPPASSLRLNPDCRSHHLGWIVYACADRLTEPGH